MKDRCTVVGASTLVLVGSLVTQIVSAAPLPNAWKITDNSGSAGSSVNYTNLLPLGVQTEATNSGFDFSVNARFVSDYGSGGRTMVMLYSDGVRRWQISWGLTNGDLVSLLITNVSPVQGTRFVVTASGTGRTFYRTHRIVYTNGAATYMVDGKVLTTGWAGSTASGLAPGQIMWGAGSTAGVGEMNFNSVSFIVTNQAVAGYNAGTVDNPSNSPDPVSQGWNLSVSSPPLNTGTNFVAPDIVPGAVTTLADSGPGSLRDAVAFANTNMGGANVIFDPALSGQTITLTSGQLKLSNDMAIATFGLPAGLAISGNSNSAVFQVTSNATVTVNRFLIQHGWTSGDGGAVLVDLGGKLTIINSTIERSYAGGYGGGIYNRGTLALLDSVSRHNSAGISGGGIRNEGALTGTNCFIIGNSATYGGGAANSGNMTVNRWTISGNSAAINSGGLESSLGTLTVLNSTISGNSASFGGGIAGFGGGTVVVSGSTIFGNSVTNGGGGIENHTSTFMLNNSTVAGNAANNGGGVLNFQGVLSVTNVTLTANSANNNGGGIYNNGGTVGLANSIVVGNSAPNGTDLSGSFSGANNLTNGDPVLAPLGNYGGLTQTMPPLAGSPAIDAGDSSFAGVLTTDQRGYPRLSGAHVDIGAVEAQLASADNSPRLTDFSWAAGPGSNSFQFLFTNNANADFTVLASTNVALPPAQWAILAPAIQVMPGQYRFTDSAATNFLERFYRVVSP